MQVRSVIDEENDGGFINLTINYLKKEETGGGVDKRYNVFIWIIGGAVLLGLLLIFTPLNMLWNDSIGDFCFKDEDCKYSVSIGAHNQFRIPSFIMPTTNYLLTMGALCENQHCRSVNGRDITGVDECARIQEWEYGTLAKDSCYEVNALNDGNPKICERIDNDSYGKNRINSCFMNFFGSHGKTFPQTRTNLPCVNVSTGYFCSFGSLDDDQAEEIANAEKECLAQGGIWQFNDKWVQKGYSPRSYYCNVK
jgi:hypothetical protein